ncbi:unnamed protein product [Mytilus coruscus]|uniref:Reverse transcriptase domain-containing protein n=1 Tax=Mytilus coruscus TaxID=42192 RepID=A0A6J8BNJ3_MYTCO|nr:unnamed protein product [Mytilus coruscus]
MNRVNWEKCDTLKYQRILNEKFNSLDIASGTLDEQFQNVADILKTSAEESSDEVKKRRVQKLKPWPMNLRSLCHDSKQAYIIFKQDGVKNVKLTTYGHQIVKRNLQNILTLQNSVDTGMQYATLDEVTATIGKMKNGKSPDELNLMSEHLKCGGQIVPIILKALFDRVLQGRDFSGIITPIHKSHGKPLHDLNSYRRITVCSIKGKVFKTIHMSKISPDLDRLQNKLQRGFTKRVSPTNAALLFTEALADAKDRKKKIL